MAGSVVAAIPFDHGSRIACLHDSGAVTCKRNPHSENFVNFEELKKAGKIERVSRVIHGVVCEYWARA